VPELGRPPTQQRQKRSRPGGGAEKMGQSVRPLGKLYGLHSGLVEQDGTFEHVHGRRVQPGAEIHEPASLGALALDDGRRRLAGESRRMEHVVIQQNADHPCPLERRQRSFDRAT
jgi:hypothetical protein